LKKRTKKLLSVRARDRPAIRLNAMLGRSTSSHSSQAAGNTATHATKIPRRPNPSMHALITTQCDKYRL
jgi:hypothetical protein